MAALEGGRRLHRLADDARHRDWRLRALDRAAQGRHRQQARRFRICEDRDVILPPRPARGKRPDLPCDPGEGLSPQSRSRREPLTPTLSVSVRRVLESYESYVIQE